MVLIDDKKYACETCIKGHRSSTCKHTDRPLFEIKKKGRPVTQCEHCRELRKTKQVHVKCICGAQNGSEQPMFKSSKKGGNKLPGSAAFPHGLPEDLEASVALQLLSEGLSDSDRGEHPPANSCSCQAGGPCYCFTHKRSAPRRRKSGDRQSDEERDHQKALTESNRTNEPEQSPLSSQVLARISELRPVLPRPSNRSANLVAPSHDSSCGVTRDHSMRHYTRDNVMFSPYSRAYDMSHGLDTTYGHEQRSVQEIPQDMANVNRLTICNNQQSLDIPSSVESWLSTGESFPSTCNCGDGCTCPGCVEHNGGGAAAPGVSVFSLCANPGGCSHCLDCTILSLPASFPLDSTVSIYDPSQSQAIDEWIRQISAQSIPVSDSTPSSLSTGLTMAQPYAPPPWDNTRMPRPSESTRNSPSSECCNGRCRCPAGFCRCPADCCGCCQGCDCAEHEHHENPAARTGGLTFATSGERGSCCSGARRRAIRSLESFERGSRMNLSPVGPPSSHMPTSSRGLLDIPDLSRSRSSSASSQSVPESGYTTDLSAMFTTPRTMLLRKLPSSSAPQLHITGSPSLSPLSGSPDGSGIDPNTGITYAPSNPDSEASSDNQGYSQYNPSLGGIHLY